MNRIRLIVSDLHLSRGRYLSDRTKNILEDFIHDREFSEFLQYYSSGDYATVPVELILNGDIFDLLQMDTFGVHTHLITERSVVRNLQRIVKGHPEFFEALRVFVKQPGKSLVYVVGNHDVGMLWDQPRAFLKEVCEAHIEFRDISYEFDGIYVEHGQQYEGFARFDPNRPFLTRGLPEPVLNLPWGSQFVAVCLPKIKQQRPHIDKTRPFQTFVRWAFLHDFFWSLKTVGVALNFVFQTLLFKNRFQVRGGVQNTFALLKEVTIYPNYDKVAMKILDSRPDLHIVIFGHTHILRFRQHKEGKLYINEGTWSEVTSLDLSDYGTRTRLTYVLAETHDSEQQAGEKTTKAQLKEWKGRWKPETDVL